LFNEIKKKSTINSAPEIYIFNSLADGLKHYKTKRPQSIENLPSDEELTAIAQEELEQSISKTLIKCQRCRYEILSDSVPKPSQFGGWTYQYLCHRCGHLNDFGEPCDD
jgi:DNA-directed RNA polymerase subunit RPC12/RpoP